MRALEGSDGPTECQQQTWTLDEAASAVSCRAVVWRP